MDIVSGIGEYQICNQYTSGGTDVVDWASNGLVSECTRTGLSLVDGQRYYWTVKARDVAGNWSDLGYADGVTVDSIAPTTPVVIDDGTQTMSTTQLHATWSATDSISGICNYQYAIGTYPGGTNVAGWMDNGTATSVTRTGLSLTVGDTTTSP